MKLTAEELYKIQAARQELTLEEREEMRLEFGKRIKRDKHNPFFSSSWEGNTFVQKLVVNEVTVRQYLEDCIRFWRNSSAPYAVYYVDAFQSAYSAIFCGTYPVVEQDEEVGSGSSSSKEM